jgi:hypothetical protein
MSEIKNIRINCHRPDFVSFTIPNFDSSFPGYPKIDYKNILRVYSKPNEPSILPLNPSPSSHDQDGGGEEETKISSNKKTNEMNEKDKEEEQGIDLEIETNETPVDPLRPALKSVEEEKEEEIRIVRELNQ